MRIVSEKKINLKKREYNRISILILSNIESIQYTNEITNEKEKKEYCT